MTNLDPETLRWVARVINECSISNDEASIIQSTMLEEFAAALDQPEQQAAEASIDDNCNALTVAHMEGYRQAKAEAGKGKVTRAWAVREVGSNIDFRFIYSRPDTAQAQANTWSESGPVDYGVVELEIREVE